MPGAPDVLQQGRDDPRARRHWPVPLVVGALAVLALGVGAVAITRTSERRPTTSGSPTPTPIPTPTPSAVESIDLFQPDGFTVLPAPAAGGTGVGTLSSGEIVYITQRHDGSLSAVGIFADVPIDPVTRDSFLTAVRGLCPTGGHLEDPVTGSAWDSYGRSYDGLGTTAIHDARPGRKPGTVEVSLAAIEGGDEAEGTKPPKCPPGTLMVPPLPAASSIASLPSSSAKLMVVHGALLIDHRQVRLCNQVVADECLGASIIDGILNEPLLPRDLAGSYVLRGDFAVRDFGRSDPTYRWEIARLPSARVIARRDVGVATRIGFVRGSYLRRGVPHLRFNPFAYYTGNPVDDSPDGAPMETPRAYQGLLIDERGGLLDYAVRLDAEVIVSATVNSAAALANDYSSPDRVHDPGTALWLIFDATGSVIRVVAQTGNGAP